MRVLIDADGCPVVRETVRQCAAFHVPCLLFCDTAHVFSIPGVAVFVADCGHDSTDYLLLSHLRPGDVVITQDYGLAALCLARSAQALHPAGHAYTKDNIDAQMFDIIRSTVSYDLGRIYSDDLLFMSEMPSKAAVAGTSWNTALQSKVNGLTIKINKIVSDLEKNANLAR